MAAKTLVDNVHAGAVKSAWKLLSKRMSKSAIGRAVLDCFEGDRLLVEPARAMALAAARTSERQAGYLDLAGCPIVATVSGGNTTADFIPTLQGALS